MCGEGKFLVVAEVVVFFVAEVVVFLFQKCFCAVAEVVVFDFFGVEMMVFIWCRSVFFVVEVVGFVFFWCRNGGFLLVQKWRGFCVEMRGVLCGSGEGKRGLCGRRVFLGVEGGFFCIVAI